MEIDPQAARLLRMMAAGARTGSGRIGIAERRRAFDGLMRFSGPPPDVAAIEERTIPGPGGPLGLRIYTPAGGGTRMSPGLIYFHGGGLVAGSLASYDVLVRTLANGSGCRLVAVDYRLAPEHPFPAAIEDALAAVRCVFDKAGALGLDPARIAIGGDSAGGTLTAIATQALRGPAGVPLRCQVLLCPVLDFGEERPSKRAFGEGFLLDTALMARDLDDYAPGLPLDDPLVSPLRAADLSGLPPALVHTAGFDPLRDEGRHYAERLAAAGVEVRYTCHDTMVHHFYGLGGLVPAARTILDQIGRDLGAVLRSAPADGA